MDGIEAHFFPFNFRVNQLPVVDASQTDLNGSFKLNRLWIQLVLKEANLAPQLGTGYPGFLNWLTLQI